MPTNKVNRFTKEQILKSKTFGDYTDFLSGNLSDDKTYTKEEVTKLIDRNYRKGKGE